MSEEQIAKGHVQHFYVWSSTRKAFQLDAKLISSPNESIVLGAPIPLNPKELRELEKENNSAPPETGSHGPVLSGYKIPVTIRSDDKVSYDIGPILRTVQLSSRDLELDGLLLSMTGRVRGLVELGLDDEGSLDFGQFSRKDGAKAKLQLLSSVKDIKLSVDTKRTAPFLVAALKGPLPAGETRQSWTLEAQVKKGQVSGGFPRREDPLFADSAIYLIAEVSGQKRPIRIAVRGTANES